ncbi:hypothetical protein BT96DRAFT_867119 [Gymnopus androsaceus JB14]|uniref:Uncharacterized protein n=1 Tax=Gymnopus androsaceus JB14 TaxID=1447944 RepID=A0A6A4GRA4_9AGAR|nr:hypothetical protein BT96DRAFT_867119 [Gymnopus androsaceus JB14]
MLVDKIGSRSDLFGGFCLLLVDYSGIRVIYDTGRIPDLNTSESIRLQLSCF